MLRTMSPPIWTTVILSTYKLISLGPGYLQDQYIQAKSAGSGQADGVHTESPYLQ